MKRTILFLPLLLPLSTLSAESFDGLSPEQIQLIMQQAQSIQKCMQSIDQSSLMSFEQRANQLITEIRALCANGKRDEAMERAMSFENDAGNSNIMQVTKRCGANVINLMPEIASGPEKTASNICDQM